MCLFATRIRCTPWPPRVSVSQYVAGGITPVYPRWGWLKPEIAQCKLGEKKGIHITPGTWDELFGANVQWKR